MLLPGTQMHIATFLFVCIEIVIFFYIVIYRLARPDDPMAYLNIFLILLLIIYNVSGGLLPDANLPGSYFVQTSIAYGTGFITPCYFPYYVFHAFGLEKMKFHVYKGVYLFLILPYIIFITAFGLTGNLVFAKHFLILPVAYAIWVIFSLNASIRYKYGNQSTSSAFKEEASILFLSIAAWIGLPIIDYFNLGQSTEAVITNVGFLLLLGLQVKRHIKVTRAEHQQLIASEARLLNWNSTLQHEVEKRTKQLEKLTEQRINTFVNLAHETKTPLTLISNYLEEYLNTNKDSEELSIVKRSFDKLSQDIGNLFDLEKFNKGFSIYNHDCITNCSEIISDSLILFEKYAVKKKVEISSSVQPDVYTQANPLAINRIVNNLVENAIKYSFEGGKIDVFLQASNDKLAFSVRDEGAGIPVGLQKKVFEPYFQISTTKGNFQGMGLGLPIVKKVVEDLAGTIQLVSAPLIPQGTEVKVLLRRHLLKHEDTPASHKVANINMDIDRIVPEPEDQEITRPHVLIVEDNISMANYLQMKLRQHYHVRIALNGNEAFKLLKEHPPLPDIIISDVMMDKLDGFEFAKIISNDKRYKHIPIVFLSAKSTKEDKLQGLKLGAIDFIRKPFSIYELLQKIASLLSVISNQKKALLNGTLASTHESNDSVATNRSQFFEQNCEIYHLTLRERDVAKLICEGYKYKKIADSLYISERTVTKHAQNIFEKLNISSKIELINKLEGGPALQV